QFALTLAHESSQVVYLTDRELQERPDVVQDGVSDGLQVVRVSEAEKARLERQAQSGGPEVRTAEVFIREYNQSFQCQFVDVSDLTEYERQVFGATAAILWLVGIQVADQP